MSNAERELTDLTLEFVNFVKKIRSFLRFFNAAQMKNPAGFQ